MNSGLRGNNEVFFWGGGEEANLEPHHEKIPNSLRIDHKLINLFSIRVIIPFLTHLG